MLHLSNIIYILLYWVLIHILIKIRSFIIMGYHLILRELIFFILVWVFQIYDTLSTFHWGNISLFALNESFSNILGISFEHIRYISFLNKITQVCLLIYWVFLTQVLILRSSTNL